MSVWDVTGALIWGWCAVGGWIEYSENPRAFDSYGLLLLVTTATVWCIARLLGAHL